MNTTDIILLVVALLPVAANLLSLVFRLLGWHGAAEKLDQLAPLSAKLGETLTKQARAKDVGGVFDRVARGELSPEDGARILTGAAPKDAAPSIKAPPMPPLGVLLLALGLSGCDLTPAQTAGIAEWAPPIAGATCHLVAAISGSTDLEYACKRAEGAIAKDGTGPGTDVAREQIVHVPREHQAEFEAANTIER